MTKKQLIIAGALMVFIANAAFWSGLQYDQTTSSASTGVNQFRGQAGLYGGTRVRQNGGQFITGEILTKDDTSATIKLAEGGSKIILFGESTQMDRLASITPEELKTGEQVFVSGTENTDGSVTARTLQIRPDLPQRDQTNASDSAGTAPNTNLT